MATRSENIMNARKRTDNKSGVRGVYKCGNKWVCEISINHKKIYLGSYKTLTEASKIRTEKARELFGEFCNE
jgi:hypothetical protein